MNKSAYLLGYLDKTAKDKVPGGKADGRPAKDFSGKQITKGVKIEMEHTNDKNLAEEISKDHLSEFPDYYDRLDAMEEKAKKESGD